MRITLPVKIIESELYDLVLLHSNGYYHYFDYKGEYDGWSRDTIILIEENNN